MSLHIGSLEFDSPLFMAPMEGITDVPFRKIVRKHGCSVVCTQMLHAEGFLRGTTRRMHEIATMDKSEEPIGLQLCGSTPHIVAEAARKAVDKGAAFIDINMGCPAKNVVKNGAGAALLLEPENAGKIVREVVRNVSVPVTTKIRAGWDDRYRNASEIASILEKEGSALVTVHARTKTQRHSGAADWNLLSEIKERLSVPVIGNGGVTTYEEIQQMIQETGVDGVMVARGALGNPWIFENRRPTVEDIRKTVLEHLEAHLSFYENQAAALVTFRKHLVWYTRGLANAAEFRLRVFHEKSHEVILEMIHRFFDQLDPQSPRIPSHAS